MEAAVTILNLALFLRQHLHAAAGLLATAAAQRLALLLMGRALLLLPPDRVDMGRLPDQARWWWSALVVVVVGVTDVVVVVVGEHASAMSDS